MALLRRDRRSPREKKAWQDLLAHASLLEGKTLGDTTPKEWSAWQKRFKELGQELLDAMDERAGGSER